MDWYYGCGVDELIVPNDGVLSDRLPSPDSWSEWGIGGPETFPSQYKCGAFDQFSAEEDGFDTKSACGDVEMEDSAHDYYPSTGSTVYGDFSDERARISSNGPDYQLGDLAGSGRTDDIFLSSLHEDLPGFENLDQSFCFSPKYQRGTTGFNDYERDMNSEFQNASSDVQSPESSMYLKTCAFSPSLGLENDCSSDSELVEHNLEEKDIPSVEDSSGGESVPSGKNNVNRDIDDETSLEAAVLLELKMISSQLTEKTRIRFRDSLYRLAKNSNQHCLIQNQDGDLFVEIPPSTLDAETKRYETRKATESETNIIDRAIANLMFNKTDLNVRDRPNVAALSNFNSYRPPQIHNSSDSEGLPDDAEVPIYLCPTPTENLSRSGGNKSLVLEFGSVA